MKLPLAALALTAFLAGGPLHAGVLVQITVEGSVVSNQVNSPPLGNIQAGAVATLSFCVDSDVFVNNPSFPTRGYTIDPSSFTLSSGNVAIGLQNPFPAGQTPYFVIRDNDPAVDGFIVATNLSSPTGVPLAQAGQFGQFLNNFYVTYTGATLPSLDILDALGTYGFNGLTVFNWTVDDGPFNPIIIDFTRMSIECKALTEVYCTAKPGLACGTPGIGSAGAPSASATSGFVVSAGPARSQRTGVLLYTDMGRANLPFPSGGHILCIALPMRRGGPADSGGSLSCDGVFSLDMNAFASGNYAPGFPTYNPAAYLAIPGQQVNCQWWGRDSPATGSFMSDALEYRVCP